MNSGLRTDYPLTANDENILNCIEKTLQSDTFTVEYLSSLVNSMSSRNANGGDNRVRYELLKMF